MTLKTFIANIICLISGIIFGFWFFSKHEIVKIKGDNKYIYDTIYSDTNHYEAKNFFGKKPKFKFDSLGIYKKKYDSLNKVYHHHHYDYNNDTNKNDTSYIEVIPYDSTTFEYVDSIDNDIIKIKSWLIVDGFVMDSKLTYEIKPIVVKKQIEKPKPLFYIGGYVGLYSVGATALCTYKDYGFYINGGYNQMQLGLLYRIK